ncbi:MAG: DUF4412 domain-containing protein [Desulfobacteraceae bacterium]|nr:MAG: DUF4412 domain-containing protein [Desulfobacteraceae bacterium]
MKGNIFVLAALTGLVVLGSMGQALADLYIETEQVSQGIPGQKAGPTTIKSYLSANATMTDTADRITIVDFKQKLLYDLDKNAKTYTKNEIEKMGLPGADKDDENPEQTQMMQAMMKSMAQSVKVTPTDETKTVSGYKCRKYLVSIMMANSDYWVTKDFQGYDEMKAIGEKTSKLFMDNPMLSQMNIMGMMKDLDGLPVQTHSRMMGGTITATVKKIEHKKLDPSLFQVPAGYKLVKKEQ